MARLANELLHGTKMYYKQFAQACEPVKQYLEIKDSAYFNVYKDGSLISIHSNYSWMKGYVEGKHYNLDPHIVHPDNISEGFSPFILNDRYQYAAYDDTASLYKAEATDRKSVV